MCGDHTEGAGLGFGREPAAGGVDETEPLQGGGHVLCAQPVEFGQQRVVDGHAMFLRQRVEPVAHTRHEGRRCHQQRRSPQGQGRGLPHHLVAQSAVGRCADSALQ